MMKLLDNRVGVVGEDMRAFLTPKDQEVVLTQAHSCGMQAGRKKFEKFTHSFERKCGKPHGDADMPERTPSLPPCMLV